MSPPELARLPIDGVAPGTRQRLLLPLDTLGGPAASVAFEVIVGRQRRPRLAVVGGVHGDEYDGILATQALARETRPDDLIGTLLVIPVANPFAFAAARRRTPHDDTDLNRVFPGDPAGSLSQRLAHRLCTGVLDQADLIFTLHGNTAEGVLRPWLEFLDADTPVGRAARAAARASGFPDLIALSRLPGRLLTAMTDRGVPLIEGEVGGRGATRPEHVAYYIERARAVARHLGVLAARAPLATPAPEPRVWRLGGVATEAGGIMLRAVDLGAMVAAGQCLARVVDAVGAEVGQVIAPYAGCIGGYRDHAGVAAGDHAFTIWRPMETTAEAS